jgi:hypothetical protein
MINTHAVFSAELGFKVLLHVLRLKWDEMQEQ